MKRQQEVVKSVVVSDDGHGQWVIMIENCKTMYRLIHTC